jgi:hypothetical protein
VGIPLQAGPYFLGEVPIPILSGHWGKKVFYSRVLSTRVELEKMAKNAGVTTSKINFCDLLCEFSDFAKIDALDGSCRTFQSLWCKKLQKHVTKNAPCEVKFGTRRPTTGF